MKNEEKFTRGINGFLMLTVTLLLVLGCIGLFIANWIGCGILLSIITCILFGGFKIIDPNEAAVLILFGKYMGTISDNGFIWVNPFTQKKIISLRARNLNSEQIKVNDKMGNPVLISAVLVWKVSDTYKASFDVDNYVNFVDIQSEAAIRNLAAAYCYDSMEGNNEETEITLRGGGEEVNNVLESALRDRLTFAGIEVIEARISNLAYAPEIAGAMLQRQQATAVVAARQKIVEGAVGMVEMALNMLSEREIVELDAERKAAMVSNLMVVLTSDKSATPIVNAGTLYN